MAFVLFLLFFFHTPFYLSEISLTASRVTQMADCKLQPAHRLFCCRGVRKKVYVLPFSLSSSYRHLFELLFL